MRSFPHLHPQGPRATAPPLHRVLIDKERKHRKKEPASETQSWQRWCRWVSRGSHNHSVSGMRSSLTRCCGEPELRCTRRLLSGAEHTFVSLGVTFPALPAQLDRPFSSSRGMIILPTAEICGKAASPLQLPTNHSVQTKMLLQEWVPFLHMVHLWPGLLQYCSKSHESNTTPRNSPNSSLTFSSSPLCFSHPGEAACRREG